MSHPVRLSTTRNAFSLVELLVVVALVAVLVSLLLPALGAARESGRSAVCLSNLRQCFIACRAYADDHRGHGPALGRPYVSLPNWAIVVQESGGFSGSGGVEHFTTRSALVCPSVRAAYAREMHRTSAVNATGLAGAPGDRADYDTELVHVGFDAVLFPSTIPLLIDSACLAQGPELPPPTRTASVLDFRNESHIGERIGRFHAGRRGAFNAGFFDGSAREQHEVAPGWLESLP